MQFNGVNNKECWSYLACQWCCEMCMHQDPICLFSWIWVHCSMFKWVLNSVLAFLAFLDKFSEHLFSLVFHNCKDSVYNSFSLPSLFPLTCSVWRVPAFFSCTICDGGSRQGCQDLLAMRGTPFKELAVHSGSSSLSHSPNFHFAMNC